MKLPIYQVDAFAERLFEGNPAAVCVLPAWIDASRMQAIAAENNLAETAFLVAVGPAHYEIRWFTPTVEVDLCGHATLASAHALWQHCGIESDQLHFDSHQSGALTCRRSATTYTLNFPADPPEPCGAVDGLLPALGGPQPLRYLRGKHDVVVVYASPELIVRLNPDFNRLRDVRVRGIIVTAPGENGIDFVSRFFGPAVGIDEDPVTGSAHTTLAPFWSRELGKTKMTARQLSSRGGHLFCEVLGDRVEISGHAVTYLVGEINAG